MKYDRGIYLVFKWFQKTYHAPLQFSNANEAANVKDAFILSYPPVFIVTMFHMNGHQHDFNQENCFLIEIRLA